MPSHLTINLPRLLTALFVAGAALFPLPAAAQAVVALVNGEPITALDVQQRLRLVQTSGKPNATRKEILDELIDQKLKFQIATRASISVTSEELERAFTGIAQRSNRSSTEFTAALTQGGIDVPRLKARIRTDLAWQQYLQANAGHVMVRDADIVAVMAARGQNPQTQTIQYTMQQVIFVTRRNAQPAVRAARAKAAEALRSRVNSCEQVQALAREYPEVVVKPPVRRLSSDLAPNLQKLLEKTPDGKMTPPEPTVNGIEVVAICERKQVSADVSANRDLRNELLGQRVQAYEKKILDQMRQKSIIRILSETTQ